MSNISHCLHVKLLHWLGGKKKKVASHCHSAVRYGLLSTFLQYFTVKATLNVANYLVYCKINVLSGKPLIQQKIQYSKTAGCITVCTKCISFESRDVKITKMREYSGVLVKEKFFWAVLCYEMSWFWTPRLKNVAPMCFWENGRGACVWPKHQ